MKHLLFALLVFSGAMFAQETPVVEDKKAPAPKAPSLFEAAKATRPFHVAIYEGGGVGGSGVTSVSKAAKSLEGVRVTILKPEEVGTRDLSEFDMIAFTGGSGSKQAAAIGDKGLQNVRSFVKNGGGYLGICAGAYLACSNYPWSLNLLNAKTKSRLWRRGGGLVQMELTEGGRAIFGDKKEQFGVRYNNGPIIEPFNSPDLPPYEVTALFRSEVAKNGAPAGIMTDSPAVVHATYGKGRVLAISPHPEGTAGLENFIPHALVWLTTKPAASETAK